MVLYILAYFLKFWKNRFVKLMTNISIISDISHFFSKLVFLLQMNENAYAVTKFPFEHLFQGLSLL